MRKHLLRILTLVFVVCFGACLLAACGDEEENKPDDQPTTYTLTYNANGGPGADVTESHTEGEKVTLKAANTFTYSGHTFKAWNDGTKDYNANAEFTMPASNVTLKAQWTENGETPPAPTTYKVTVTGDHVTATFDKAGPYEEGTTVTFTLAVDSGFEIVTVKNGSADVPKNAEGKYYVEVGKADITITVTTKSTEQPTPTKYTVTLNMTGNTGGNTASLDKTEVEEGQQVTLTLTIASGYKAEVKINGQAVTVTGTTYTFAVTANTTVTVTFSQEGTNPPTPATYTVTMAPNENVTFAIVDPTDKTEFEEGTIVRFTVTAKPGYKVKDVKEGEAFLDADREGRYSVEVGTENIVITVVTVQQTITGVTAELQTEGEDVYLVIGGTSTNYTEKELETELKAWTHDFQRNSQLEMGSWDYFTRHQAKGEVVITVTDDGWTAKFNITELEAHPYMFHFGVADEEGNPGNLYFADTTISDSETVGNMKYELNNLKGTFVNDAMQNYGLLGIVVTDTTAATWSATLADIEAEADKAYFIISGTSVNYDVEALTQALTDYPFDFQENQNAGASGWVYESTLTRTVDVQEDGTWTIKFDITNLSNKAYTAHFGLVDVEKGHVDKNTINLSLSDRSTDGKKVSTDSKVYTLFNKFGTGGADGGSFFWGNIGIKISTKSDKSIENRSADLTMEDGKVYLVFKGDYTGYSEEELKALSWYADLERNGAKMGDQVYTPLHVLENGDVTVDTTNLTWEVKYDVTNIGANCYTLHFTSTGTKGDFMKPCLNSSVEQHTDSKNYALVTYIPANDNDGEHYWGNYGLEISEVAAEVKTTVTFDTGAGGSTVESQTYTENATFDAPQAPTKTDYKFLYWYYLNGEDEEEVGEGFVPSDHAPNGSLTLYAKWMTHNYPEHADANGNYVCSDCGAILHSGYANATKIGAEVFNEGGEYTSEHGMTVAFWLLSANSDWDSIAIRTVFGGLNVTLPNLQTNVMTDVSSDAVLSGLKTAFKQTNLFPGDGINQGGSTWDTFKDSNGANSFVTVTLSKTTGVTYYKNGVVQFIYAANLAVGDKTVADFVEAIFLAAKHDGILIGATQFEGTISIEDAMAAPSAMDATAVKALYDSYLAEKEFYPEGTPIPTHPAYNDLTENAKAAAESNNATTVAFTNQISKGEKIVFEGTHTSATDVNWDAVKVGLFTGMSGTFQIRSDRWVDGTDLSDTQTQYVGVDTQNDEGGTFKAYHWTYTKSNSTFTDWTNSYLPLKKNGYFVITLDWTDETKLAVTLSFSKDAASKAESPLAFTYTISAEEGSALEDSYTFTIIANYCTIDLSATTVPTRTPAAD